GPARSAVTASVTVDPGRSTETICSPWRNQTFSVGPAALDPVGNAETMVSERARTTASLRAMPARRGRAKLRGPTFDGGDEVLTVRRGNATAPAGRLRRFPPNREVARSLVLLEILPNAAICSAIIGARPVFRGTCRSWWSKEEQTEWRA